MEKIKTQHFIINLDKRKDRWKQVCQDVMEIGIDVPNRMKAIVITKYGSPSVLNVKNVEKPGVG